jgi:hypothetical protein
MPKAGPLDPSDYTKIVKNLDYVGTARKVGKGVLDAVGSVFDLEGRAAKKPPMGNIVKVPKLPTMKKGGL